MPDSKRKILIVENQQRQHKEIVTCLGEFYEVYPDHHEYICFIDNVRVWVNEGYKPDYRAVALTYLNNFIQEHEHFELILMDHKLGGAHKCKTGIDLAMELNRPRKETNCELPVIFISKTEHTDENRIERFDAYQSKYPNTSNWVHKGYFGDEILQPEFLEKNVIPEIESLLKKSIASQIIEKLNENKPKITVSTGSTEREIVVKTMALIDDITQGKAEATIDLLSRLNESQLDSQYLELLNSKLVVNE